MAPLTCPHRLDEVCPACAAGLITALDPFQAPPELWIDVEIPELWDIPILYRTRRSTKETAP